MSSCHILCPSLSFTLKHQSLKKTTVCPSHLLPSPHRRLGTAEVLRIEWPQDKYERSDSCHQTVCRTASGCHGGACPHLSLTAVGHNCLVTFNLWLISFCPYLPCGVHETITERCHGECTAIDVFVLFSFLPVQWFLSEIGRSESGQCHQMQGFLVSIAGAILHTHMYVRTYVRVHRF